MKEHQLREQLRAPFKARGLRVRITMHAETRYEATIIPMPANGVEIEVQRGGEVKLYVDDMWELTPADALEHARRLLALAEACAEIKLP